MPAAGGRRGRRDNGLVASEYEAVGDVDPRIGEHLLDVLGAGGIAAYLQPSTDLHPITRTTSLPKRPTDRLFVDRDHLITAQDYIRRIATDPERITTEPGPHGTEPERGVAAATEPDLDAAWREIMAGYHLSVEPAAAPWPKSEEITLGEPRLLPHIEPADPTAESRPGRFADPAEPSLLDALDTFGAELPDDDDEGYTPPPAPPLPRLSRAAGLGTAAIVFGILLFVWPAVLPLAHDQVLLIAFGSIVAGFGTLIWRLRPDDEEEDDADDGAVI